MTPALRLLAAAVRRAGLLLGGAPVRTDVPPAGQLARSPYAFLSDEALRRLIDETYSRLDTARPAPGLRSQYDDLLEELEARRPAW
jgi:hypothetical protein